MNGKRKKNKSWDEVDRHIIKPYIFYKDQYGRSYVWTEPSKLPEEAPNRIEKDDGSVLKKIADERR